MMENSKVKVYRFKRYDIQNDEYQVSRRWGTLDGIKAVCGVALQETETQIDAALIGKEVDGLTDRNFDPHAFSSPGIMR